jgi:hypothetical protein
MEKSAPPQASKTYENPARGRSIVATRTIPLGAIILGAIIARAMLAFKGASFLHSGKTWRRNERLREIPADTLSAIKDLR